MSVELVSLGECCKFVSGSTVPLGEEYRKQPDGYLILKVSDLNLPENQYTVSDSNEWIANAPKGSMVCSENSIVLPKRGGAISTNKKRLLLRPAILDPNLMGITPQLSKLDPKYLYYWFQQFDLTSITSGSAVPQLNKQDLDPLRFPLPPLTEQKRIASLLARADRLRQLRRTTHDLGDALLQSVFLEMFGNPVSNEKGHEVYYLAELCESPNGIKAGPFGSSLKKEIYTKSGYRIYGQEQVIGGSFSIGDYYISKEMFEKDFKPYEVKPKDILISLVGTFGKTIIVPQGIEPGIINPRLLKISPRKDRLNSVFLSEYLQLSSVQKRLSDLSHGGTMGILNAGQLKEFKVICPPLSLQEEFAGVVARVESLRGRMSEGERQVDGLFESLLAEAFS